MAASGTNATTRQVCPNVVFLALFLLPFETFTPFPFPAISWIFLISAVLARRSPARYRSLLGYSSTDGATFSPAFCGPFICGHGGCLPPTPFVPAAKALSGAYEEGIAGMLTIIKASLLGSALMLLESCTGYLTSYQTPCIEGHVCECVQYTTINRSWLDCRDYGRVKSRVY